MSVDSLSHYRGPPSTVAGSEEPQIHPSRKGKEKAHYADNEIASDTSEQVEDKLRIQMLEAEVERLRSEVSVDTSKVFNNFINDIVIVASFLGVLSAWNVVTVPNFWHPLRRRRRRATPSYVAFVKSNPV